MTDGARMSSIRQSLQDEVPALLKQAALLRGVAERASQELKAVRRQQQAYKRRAKMHRVSRMRCSTVRAPCSIDFVRNKSTCANIETCFSLFS